MLFFTAFFPLSAYAAGWTQDEGRFFLSSKAFYYHNDAFFNRSGMRESQPDFRKAELNIYGEYGWRDSTTLGANLFLHAVEQNSDSGSQANYGLGDNELFVRQRLLQRGRYVLALQPLIKLPAIYTENRLPRGGREDWDAELALQPGFNFTAFGREHIFTAHLGYRHRFGDGINDQWRADAQLGLQLTDRLTLQPAFYTIWATDIPANAAFSQSGENDYDLVKLEAALDYQFNDVFSFTGGGFSHVDGRNSGGGYGLFLGTAFRF